MYQTRIKASNLILDLSKLDYYQEYTGFNCYLPIGFFTDLLNFLIHKQLGKRDFIILSDDVSNVLLSIPGFIIDSYKSEKNIICKALYILKYISGNTSLIGLENNIFEESNNYKNCIDSFEFTINSDITNKYILDNTKLLNTLHNLLSDGNKSNVTEKVKAIGYKNILSMRSSLTARPDLPYQLTKNTSYSSSKKELNSKSIIFVEDVSRSMSDGHNKDSSDLIKFLLCELNYPIYHFCKNNNRILNTREEKLKAFSTTNYYNTIYDWNNVLLSIDKDFKEQKIVVLNDGEDFVPNNLKLNNQLFILNTGVTNKNAQDLCKLNKGQQIKI